MTVLLLRGRVLIKKKLAQCMGLRWRASLNKNWNLSQRMFFLSKHWKIVFCVTGCKGNIILSYWIAWHLSVSTPAFLLLNLCFFPLGFSWPEFSAFINFPSSVSLDSFWSSFLLPYHLTDRILDLILNVPMQEKLLMPMKLLLHVYMNAHSTFPIYLLPLSVHCSRSNCTGPFAFLST